MHMENQPAIITAQNNSNKMKVKHFDIEYHYVRTRHSKQSQNMCGGLSIQGDDSRNSNEDPALAPVQGKWL